MRVTVLNYAFLALALIFLFITSRGSDFSIKEDIQRYSCSQAALSQNISLAVEYCNKIGNRLVRDYCFFDVAKKRMLKYVTNGEACLQIEELYLRAECERRWSRPHNWFFERSFDGEGGSNVRENAPRNPPCEEYESDYFHSRCVTEAAVIKAAQESDAAEDICLLLKSEYDLSRCLYFVSQVAFASSFGQLVTNPQPPFVALTSFCDRIPHPNWKAECFFYIADNFGTAGLLKDALLACEKADGILNVGCRHHVVFDAVMNDVLNVSDGVTLCQTVGGENDPGMCYNALVTAIDETTQDLPPPEEVCSAFPSQFQDSCLLSFALRSHTRSNEEAPLGGPCAELPTHLTLVCSNIALTREALQGAGEEYYSAEEYLDGLIQRCKMLSPKGSIEECIEGVMNNLWWYLELNPLSPPMVCEMIEKPHRERCYYHVGLRVGYLIPYKEWTLITLCDEVNPQYQQACLEGMSRGTGMHPKSALAGVIFPAGEDNVPSRPR